MNAKSYLRFIAAGYDGEIASSQAPIATFTMDAKPYVVAAVHHTAVIYDLTSSTKQRTYFSSLTGRLPQAVSTLAVSNDGRFFVVGYGGGHVAIWPTQPPEELIDASILTDTDAIIAATAHRTTGRVTCSAFAPDGSLAVTGSSDTTVVVWDVALRDTAATLIGHVAPVTAVGLLPPPSSLMSGAADEQADAGGAAAADSSWRVASSDSAGHVRLWNLDDGSCSQVLRPLAAAVSSLATSVLGDRLVVAGAADELRVLRWPVWEVSGGGVGVMVGGMMKERDSDEAAGEWVFGDAGGVQRQGRGRVTAVYTTAPAGALVGGAAGDGSDSMAGVGVGRGKVSKASGLGYVEVLGVVSGATIEVFHRLPEAVAASRLARQAARRAANLSADPDADKDAVAEAAAAATAAAAIAKKAGGAGGSSVRLPAVAEWRAAHFGVTAPWAIASAAPVTVRCRRSTAADQKAEVAAAERMKKGASGAVVEEGEEVTGVVGVRDGDQLAAQSLSLTARGPPGSEAMVVSLRNNLIMSFRRQNQTSEFLTAGSAAAIVRGGHRADVRAVSVIWPATVLDGSDRGADARARITADSLLATISAATLRIFSLVPVTAAPPDDHLTVPKPSCVMEVGPMSSALYSVAPLPGGVFVVVGTAAGSLIVVDIRGGAIVSETDAVHSSGSGVTSLAVRAHSAEDVEVLSGGPDDTAIRRWSVGVVDGKLGLVPRTTPITRAAARRGGRDSELEAGSTTIEVGSGVNAIRFSQSGRYICAALQNNNAVVLHGDTYKVHVTLFGHKLPVTSIDITHDDEIIATGSVDKNLRLWGVAFGDSRRSIFAHDETITSVRFSGRTHMLWTASRDGSIKQWDTDTHSMTQIVRGHLGPVVGIEAAPTGSLLVSAGGPDRSVRVWVRTSEKVFPEEDEEAERLAAADERLAASSAVVGGIRSAVGAAAEGDAAASTTASPLDGAVAGGVVTSNSLRLAERLADALEAVAAAAVRGEAPVEAAGRHPLTLIATALTSNSTAVDLRAALVNLPPSAAARLLLCLRALLAGGYVPTTVAATAAATLASRNVAGLLGGASELVGVLELARSLPPAEAFGMGAAVSSTQRSTGKMRRRTVTPSSHLASSALEHPAVVEICGALGGAVGVGAPPPAKRVGGAAVEGVPSVVSPTLSVAQEIVALVTLLETSASRWSHLAAELQAASALTHAACSAADGSDALLLSASLRSYKKRKSAKAHSAAYAAAEAADEVRRAESAAAVGVGGDELEKAVNRALRMDGQREGGGGGGGRGGRGRGRGGGRGPQKRARG